ncbi:hypothetical protein [Peribacillus frigoritolerans]|uniref:hypothetical protein n=1 Tax=Peribacillus frigoritolerans TaxID=450367 RepID=UPI003CFDD610
MIALGIVVGIIGIKSYTSKKKFILNIMNELNEMMVSNKTLHEEFLKQKDEIEKSKKEMMKLKTLIDAYGENLKESNPDKG